MRIIKNLPRLSQKASMLRIVRIECISNGNYRITVQNNSEIKRHSWLTNITFHPNNTITATCNCDWHTRSKGHVVGCSHIMAALYGLGRQQQRKISFFATNDEAKAQNPEKILRLVAECSPYVHSPNATIYIATWAA